ncbi:MAG: serine/threonine-protein kinase [Nannocystaceae bacterium]
MTMQDLSGKVLEERYLLDRRIGKGGQGDVYLAKDRREHTRVWAVKVLRTHNLMLAHRGGNEDFVKVLDLGAAKLIRPRPDQAHFVLSTKNGPWLTPEYAAPEFLFQGTCTVHRDIYSLGVVAFELLTGTRPFTGETLAEIARRHKQVPPEAPSNKAPRAQWPGELDAIVLKALRKDPDARFSSMREMSLRFYNVIHETSLPPSADVIDLHHRKSRRQQPASTNEVQHPIPAQEIEGEAQENVVLACVAGGKQSGATLLKLISSKGVRTSYGSPTGTDEVDEFDSAKTRKRPSPKRVQTTRMPPSGAVETAPACREDGRWATLLAVLPQIAGLLFLSFVASTIAVLLLIHAHRASPNAPVVLDTTLLEGAPTETVPPIQSIR